jgi:uncharacterized membrane protein
MDGDSDTARGTVSRPHGEPSVSAANTHRMRPGRLEAVDLLRGLMVALMVLDHSREYFSAAALRFEPTAMLQTTSALFVTRWVTHLCAPTFVLLSGLSVYLQRANGRTGNALRTRLLARGAWLILLEATVIGFAFNFAEPFLFLQVIWAIGFGMILLTPLIELPGLAVAAIGVALIGLNPLLSELTMSFLPAPLWHALFQPGPIAPLPGVVAYPALPWAGVLLLGYGIAPALLARRDHLRRTALLTGGVLLTAFAVLRLAGIGDPRPWGIGTTAVLRALSFLNVTKYPPTPQYLLLMLGTSALLLSALAGVEARRLPMLRAFGRAPFFTYVLHIFIIHTSAMLIGVAMGMPASLFSGFIENSAPLKGAGWGFGLGWVLVAWVATLLVLRPLSIRFARLKANRSDWWLSYL